MSATILRFPVERRLRLGPEAWRLVEVAAARADATGHPCDRASLAINLQRWLASETPEERALLGKARAAIAQLPRRERP